MYFNLFFVLSFIVLILHGGAGNTSFIYNNGFESANLVLDGTANITYNGLILLTNATSLANGHAFYPDPIPFKSNGSLLSFSTNFVFGIITQYPNTIGHGLAFIITPTRELLNSTASGDLGIFNGVNNSTHVVGVELDTVKDVWDKDNNHVGIDINSIISVNSLYARYFINNTFVNVSLASGKPIQIWIEYDALIKQMDVTLAPINIEKPAIPSLTLHNHDLSPILNDIMYIGFSSSTGSSVWSSHYILGWSFALNGAAPPLDISSLPKLPETLAPPPTPPLHSPSKGKHIVVIIAVSISVVAVIIICLGVFYVFQRKKKYREELEDWESEYGPHRFKYKDLYVATKGFKDKELLGIGGFGKVYKGSLPESGIEVAVKKVSHDSKQGMKEFVAEIVSMGRLRHRNLVQLLGYCRRKGELLLVYEYVPKGSLDKFLHHNNNDHNSDNLGLDWDQRFDVIKGVASGLLYLHEGWEQIVVHRDIKSSNVLLDSDLNPKLGDFGLARLHDRGSDPQTTHVMGTLGYLAPEHSRTGRATPSSDVFAFGAFLLEVVCGRRPIDLMAPRGESLLVDKVFRCWERGDLLRVVDPNLKGKYLEGVVEAVLKLGLLCSNVVAEERPTMREMVAYLDGAVAMPDLGGLELGPGGVSFVGGWKRGETEREGFKDIDDSYTTSPSGNIFFTQSASMSDSQLSQGR